MIVTVHRGTREIGGNCIEIASSSTRLIPDVGLPLVNARREPFDSFKALRATREQRIADGTIKPVPGLFTDDAPAPDAILHSHAQSRRPAPPLPAGGSRSTPPRARAR